MNAMVHHQARLQGLSAFATLVRRFTDAGLETLISQARSGRLVRGVWVSSSGPMPAGCPLSCADGVPGQTRAAAFALMAPHRNAFVLAWDAGLIGSADVLAMARTEQERRAETRRAFDARRRQIGGALAVLTAVFRTEAKPAAV